MRPITCVLSVLIATTLYSEFGKGYATYKHKTSQIQSDHPEVVLNTPFFFLAMNASLFVWACYVKKRKTIALFLRTSLYIGIILSTSDIVCGLAMVYISISTFFIEPSKEPYLSVDLFFFFFFFFFTHCEILIFYYRVSYTI